jgi:N-acetylmuramoyl-L-alanine amidase
MSNEGQYDLQLALHSNAAPEDKSGQFQGPLVLYHPDNSEAEKASELVAKSLADIYPEHGKVVLRPANNLYELVKTNAPVVFAEIAYHDNPQDAKWIEDATVAIADHLTEALAEYFDLPYARQGDPSIAVVSVQEGPLNVRRLPGIEYPRVGRLKNGDKVTVLRRIPGWSYIRMPNGNAGYTSSQYLKKV